MASLVLRSSRTLVCWPAGPVALCLLGGGRFRDGLRLIAFMTPRMLVRARIRRFVSPHRSTVRGGIWRVICPKCRFPGALGAGAGPVDPRCRVGPILGTEIAISVVP